MEESPAYAAFRRDFLGADTWATRKDGCPLRLLDALTPDERTRAEAELLSRLSLYDDWPIQGLGHLRSSAALPALRTLLSSADGSIAAYLAVAIWRIASDPSMSDLLVRLSRRFDTNVDGVPATYTMIDIVHCLAQIPSDEARSRIHELQVSGNYLISHNAKNVLKWYGGA